MTHYDRPVMYGAGRTALIEVAQASEAISHKTLAGRVGSHIRANGRWLSPICKILNALCADGPRMLSAVVMNQRREMPGVGLPKMARHLRKLGSDDPAAERAFWEAELARVYAHRWR